MRTISTSDVIVGDRYRRDPGDLETLADSIRDVGLLHPIVVTSDGSLVSGWRRLLACRDELGWEEIPARVVDECSPEAGELHENEARKNLAPSERVKLVETLRTQDAPGRPKNGNSANWHSGSFVAKIVTTEHALEEQGRSRRDHFRAAQVVRDGVPELVAAMDAGEVSIGAAAVIAAQPVERQREIVALPARERKEEVRRLRQARTPVSKRPRRGKPSTAGLAAEITRLSARIDGARESAANSRAGREKAITAIARMRESLDALEASLEAAPAPKRKPRRSQPKEEPRQAPPVIGEAALNERWARLSDEKRARATLKASVARAAVTASERDGVKLREVCETAAQGTEWSGSTVRDWIYGKNGTAGLAAYPRHLWDLVMVPGYTGGKAEAECHPAAWEAFKADYLRLEQPPLEMCYRNLQRLARKKGWTIPRSPAALKRKLDREMHPNAVVLAREGMEALSKRIPPQIRERPEKSMWGVNGDGRKSDVFVEWPDGEIARPHLMGWQDLHSSKILSWRIDRTENQDGYRLAFADLLRDYGIPKHVWMDNGRAFAAKRLTGGAKTRYRFKRKADDPVGLLTQLVGKDNIHWTTPYHGQSKPIERGFRDMASDIDKDHRFRGAYTGNKPDAKPENYRSKAIPLKEFLAVVEAGIERHNARPGRRGQGLEGRSFDEAFKESYDASSVARPTEAQLTRWLLGAEKIRANKSNGHVVLFGTRYWSERLAETLADRPAARRDVVVRFDPDHLDRPVMVETLDGKLISQAEPQGAVKFYDTKAARDKARDVARLRRLGREQLKIQGRMSDSEYELLNAEADAEEREAEAPPERSNVLAGAFGKEPPRKRPKPVAAATGTDNLIRMMGDRVLGTVKEDGK